MLRYYCTIKGTHPGYLLGTGDILINWPNYGFMGLPFRGSRLLATQSTATHLWKKQSYQALYTVKVLCQATGLD